MCVLREIKTAGIQQASRNLGRFAGILAAVTSLGTLRRTEPRFPQASPRPDHRQPGHTLFGLLDELRYSTGLIVRKLTWIGPERTGRSAATGGNRALRRRHR